MDYFYVVEEILHSSTEGSYSYLLSERHSLVGWASSLCPSSFIWDDWISFV